MKKLSLILASLLAVASLAACGSSAPAASSAAPAPAGSSAAAAAPAPAAADDVKEITIISNKIEIDGALKEYAKTYESQTGIKVNVKSFGGETPYAPALSSMLSTGEEPEIYVYEGISGYMDAKDSGRVTDLSDQPWVSDTDVAYMDDGKVVGFPVAVEGWGLGYNKALLEKAGVDPATMTNVAGIKAAFETVASKKAELGIEGVVSMAAGPGMEWVTGLHGMNAYLALGLPYNDSSKYIDMLLNEHKLDEARFTKFGEYMQLLFDYSIPSAVTTGDYGTQTGDFAAQKTAFIHQGNWTDPTFAELGASFEMGYVPHAFLDETTDGIFVGAPSWYLVNAKSKGIEAAKAFLVAMSSTPEGHDYMVNKAGMVPAYKSCTLKPAGQFSIAVQEWAAQGKIYAWHQNEMPSGFGMETLGPVFSQLASKNIDVAEFVKRCQAEAGKIQ